MPTTLTAEQVGSLNILKTELQDRHTASLGRIEAALVLAGKIAAAEAELASAKAELVTLEAQVNAESASFANFFLDKAGL